MKNIFFILFSFIISVASAQEKMAYVEKVSDSTIRIYLDENYYLTPSDCEFKSLERVAGYDFQSNHLHGAFKDFNLDGKLVLTGTYNQDKKTGLFTAFHPNGNKKWEVNFIDNKPDGDWTYYYPDGLPMLLLHYGPEKISIQSFWDRKRKQTIVDGKGNFSFIIPFEGFNEYGYPLYERRGKIVNGVPHGLWTIYFIEPNGKATAAAEEYYRNGILTDGLNLFTQENYSGTPFSFTPLRSFERVESFISKQCNFDEYTNYTQYLADKVQAGLSTILEPDFKADHFTYEVELTAKGQPKKITFKQELGNPLAQKIIETQVKTISYYYPTLVDGIESADILLISGKISVDSDNHIDVYDVKIQRNNIK